MIDETRENSLSIGHSLRQNHPSYWKQTMFRSFVFPVLVVLCLFSLVCPLSPCSAGPKANAKIEGGDTMPPQKILKKATIKRAKPVSQAVHAKAYCCVDPLTNQIIMERNANEPLPVASLTKLVTAMVVLEHMPLDMKVTVPEHIKTVPRTVIGLKSGDTITVVDLLHGLLIGSGNDCAETLACGFPGGKDKLIEAMNKRVKKLGHTQTTFYTPSGLDRKNDSTEAAKNAQDVDSNISTAKEMAQIARIAFANKIIRSISLKKGHVIIGHAKSTTYPVRTTNKLLRDNLPLYGGKTGFTHRAGHCLASEFRPGKNVLLIVVLGSPDHFRDTRLVYKNALKRSDPDKGSVPTPSSQKTASTK